MSLSSTTIFRFSESQLDTFHLKRKTALQQEITLGGNQLHFAIPADLVNKLKALEQNTQKVKVTPNVKFHHEYQKLLPENGSDNPTEGDSTISGNSSAQGNSIELTQDQIEKAPNEAVKNTTLQSDSQLQFPQGNLTLKDLQSEFELLVEKEKQYTDSNAKILLKQYKIKILEAVLAELKKRKEQQEPTSTVQPNTKNDTLFNRFIDQSRKFIKTLGRRILFYILLTSGLIMDGVASFLGIQELLALLGVFSNSTSLILGGVFCAINAALFYSFEAGMLKQALGVANLNNASLLLNLDEQEIDLTHQMNRLMVDSVTKLDQASYNTFANVADTFNNNIKHKRDDFKKEPVENFWHRLVRRGITAVGSVMMLGSGYFMAVSLLAFLAPALLGTPIGWGIVIFGMATTLAYFLSMRGKAVTRMFTPEIQRFEEVKLKLQSFDEKNKQYLIDQYKLKDSKSGVMGTLDARLSRINGLSGIKRKDHPELKAFRLHSESISGSKTDKEAPKTRWTNTQQLDHLPANSEKIRRYDRDGNEYMVDAQWLFSHPTLFQPPVEKQEEAKQGEPEILNSPALQ